MPPSPRARPGLEPHAARGVGAFGREHLVAARDQPHLDAAKRRAEASEFTNTWMPSVPE
jgi:hypothetical protein